MPLSVIGFASPEGDQVSVSSGVSIPPPHVQGEGDLWSVLQRCGLGASLSRKTGNT